MNRVWRKILHEKKQPEFLNVRFKWIFKWSRKEIEKVESLYVLMLIGGAKRDRTADLLNAIQALFQLSYSPKFPKINAADHNEMVAVRQAVNYVI